MRLEIEFDPEKNARNIRFRDISFDRAQEFDWDSDLVWSDTRQDYGEERFIAGVSEHLPPFQSFWGFVWGYKITPSRKYPQMVTIQEIKNAKAGEKPRKLYDRDRALSFRHPCRRQALARQVPRKWSGKDPQGTNGHIY
jgi:hypothetical protein